MAPKTAKLGEPRLSSLAASSSSHKVSPGYRRLYSADFLPAGHVIMAPTAFLEMCARSPIDCEHSRQTDNAAIVTKARTAILAKLDKVFSGDSGYREAVTAAIKTPPVQSSQPQTLLSHATALTQGPNYTADTPPSDISLEPADSHTVDANIPAYTSVPGALHWNNKSAAVIADSNALPNADTSTYGHSRIMRDDQTATQSPRRPAPQGPNDFLRIDFDAQVKTIAENVNDLVNQTLLPDSDAHVYHVSDYWNAPGLTSGTRGDCEDYALQKRRLLIEDGISADALSLAIVRTPHGVEHVVLILSTIQGDLVLDNLRYNIKDWRKTGYTWISRQSALDNLSWISLEDANDRPEASRVDTRLAINQ